MNYDETTSGSYSIASYREDLVTHEKQAVAWKVIGYDVNNDGTFSMDEKPTWLTNLSKTEAMVVQLLKKVQLRLLRTFSDLLALRNEGLKEGNSFR